MPLRKGYQPRTNIVKMSRVIWLQTPTVYWLGEGTISLSYFNIHGVNDVRQTEIHTAEPLVPESSAFEIELAVEKLKFTNHQVLIKSQ